MGNLILYKSSLLFWRVKQVKTPCWPKACTARRHEQGLASSYGECKVLFKEVSWPGPL